MSIRTLSLGMLLLSGALGPVATAAAQTPHEAEAGPVVQRFGHVYAVDGLDVATPTDRAYRVVFDVSQAPDALDAVNPRIETLARFLNMHAQAGVPRQNMRLAMVLHGAAGKDALDHAAYRSRFGRDNPNLLLLNELALAGVDIYLCGQTAAHRGYPKQELAAPVQLALSAMTMLVTLQADGYQLIAF